METSTANDGHDNCRACPIPRSVRRPRTRRGRRFLAGYIGATRVSYTTDLRLFTLWCLELGVRLLDVKRAHIELFARLVNALDKEYSTAGFLTTNSFNPDGSFRFDPGAWTHEDAVSPAQPRALWVGVRIRVH